MRVVDLILFLFLNLLLWQIYIKHHFSLYLLFPTSLAHYVAQTSQELTYTAQTGFKLSLSSLGHLASPGVIGVHYHTLL